MYWCSDTWPGWSILWTHGSVLAPGVSWQLQMLHRLRTLYFDKSGMSWGLRSQFLVILEFLVRMRETDHGLRAWECPETIPTVKIRPGAGMPLCPPGGRDLWWGQEEDWRLCQWGNISKLASMLRFKRYKRYSSSLHIDFEQIQGITEWYVRLHIYIWWTLLQKIDIPLF